MATINPMTTSPFLTSSYLRNDVVSTSLSPASDTMDVHTGMLLFPPLVERPRLTPPSQLPFSDLRLLATSNETQNLGNTILDTLAFRLSIITDKIRDISSENIKKLREAAERATTSGAWSVLKKIATCLLSALSVVFGIALLASGGTALIGGAMITSGILSLANFALSELGAWDFVSKQLAQDNEDHQRKIAMILPAAIGIVSGGIGLAGSAWGIASHALQFAEKAIYLAQSALATFDGVTTLGKGVSDARLLWSQADLTKIQGLLTVERNEFTTITQEIKGVLRELNNVKSKAKKAIQTILQSGIQLTRRV